MKIAIIGTGIAGNSAAWLLNKEHDITVFEKESRIGGHSNTVEVTGYPPVDTGFIVYNEWTYPNLIALFKELGVKTEKTDMSFGVSLKHGWLEYAGDALFAQKRNWLRPAFHRMWLDILRFYKHAPELLESDEPLSLGDYLARENYSDAFINYHILPMAAAIWSTAADDVRDFPAKSFVRFFVNHGLLLLRNRPQWWTVTGGSREYVAKLTAPFANKIRSGHAVKEIKRADDHVLVDGEKFDHAVIAAHSDEALRMLEDPTSEERQVLGAFPYSDNIAYLHRDKTLMPKRRKVWSSWNYLSSDPEKGVTLTYWMNRLQPFIGQKDDLFVTLNPETPPAEDKTLQKIYYAHPQFRMSALQGWQDIKKIQGVKRTWFCGAWCGYGFHEDGASAGLAVAEAIGGNKRPWSVDEEKSPAGTNCTP